MVQKIDGHDERRVVGIAAFMRNVNAAMARKVHALHSLQGHAFERTYRSHNLDRPEDLVRSLAYLHGQHAHRHVARRPGEPRWDSWAVITCGRPDGVVTDLPEFWSLLGASPEERAERTRELLQAIIDRALALDRDSQPAPWAVATAEALTVYRVSFTPAWRRLIPVPAALGADAHAQARDARLSWKWPRVAFHPRRAPRVGDVITIEIRRETQSPPFC